FMLIKRNIYDQVGGFDEDYFMYGEDIDLSYKITQAGYQNHYFGQTTVLHYKGESTVKDEAYFERFFGAMHIFYRKHFNRNFLLENSVSAGVALAKRTKKIYAEKKTKANLQPDRKYIFTENIELLEKLSETMATV